MRKNGFTLIELLAVIVILAIIAVIAVPIVLNIINNSKESALLRSADFYLDGVETAIATSVLKNIQIKDGTYSIMQDGNVCIGTLSNNTCTGDILKVEMDGEVPTSGTITITSGQVGDITLNLSNKVIVKNDKGELVLEGLQVASVCKLIDDADNSKTITPGDKYQCKVKDNMEEGFKDGYYFYVLSTEEDGTTNLIMDRNINSDGTPTTKAILESNKNFNGGIYNSVAWINQGDYESSGGKNWDDWEDNNNFGPITAMNFLNNATSSWNNIPNLNISYDDEGENFTDFKITGKARLPYYSEVNDYSESENNAYLYNNLKVDCYDNEEDCNLVACEDAGYIEGVYEEGIENIDGINGYWILSSEAGFYSRAWYVDFGGYVNSIGATNDSYSGVRPVINLKI